jgi:hypothetical protein
VHPSPSHICMPIASGPVAAITAEILFFVRVCVCVYHMCVRVCVCVFSPSPIQSVRGGIRPSPALSSNTEHQGHRPGRHLQVARALTRPPPKFHSDAQTCPRVNSGGGGGGGPNGFPANPTAPKPGEHQANLAGLRSFSSPFSSSAALSAVIGARARVHTLWDAPPGWRRRERV